MLFIISFLFALLIVSLPFWAFSKDSRFHAGAVSWQGLAAMLIAVVAGYWYLVERRGTAHANVSISATGIKLDAGTVLIQGRVAVENTGQILLEPQMLDVRLLSVIPHGGASAADLALHARSSLDQWPAELGGLPAYNGGELQWYGLRQFRAPANQEVEPGETDVRMIDMVVACDVQVAKLTVQLRKPSPAWWQWWLSEPEGGWWWKDRIVINLVPLCASEIGTVRRLGPLPVGDDDDGNREARTCDTGQCD